MNPTRLDAIQLSVFASRVAAVCEEMGAVLRRSAFSPNIRDRLDLSCALFDPAGRLCAQAAHIPVHLGSMAYAMRDLVSGTDWAPGDMLILNDPYLGGTHLPDVTLIAPVFRDDRLLGFVANRAHHADIGADTPGSMPLSRRLDEEGLVIPPARLLHRGERDAALWTRITSATANPEQAQGDFAAQISANRSGVQRVQELAGRMGTGAYLDGLVQLNEYAAQLARATLADIPDGEYCYSDCLDDDGQGHEGLEIRLRMQVAGHRVVMDFSGTAAQVRGNVNCPLSVTAAAVYYVFRCLMPPETPAAAGSFRDIALQVPAGCLLNARRPAAVAAGNVETSSRVVDVVLGALAQALPDRIPAASQGTMNNLAMGARGTGPDWDYYETIGGGMGAGRDHDGLSGVQSHMTNTLNTPVEVLEMTWPLRVHRYALRRGSGGAGMHRGGDGLVREFEFLAPAAVTLLTERRLRPPWGLAGGGPGQCGRNRLNGTRLPGKCRLQVEAGDRLRIETPGGGGWGKPVG